MTRPSSNSVGEQRKKSLLITIDVEDWFQVENFKNNIPYSAWSTLELRVEQNVYHLLDLFDAMNQHEKHRVRIEATFFILGWIANRVPGLVREIHARGHEVASHGFFHELSNQQNSATFKQDILDSKKLLEDIIGAQVFGYRAPSFSISSDILRVIEDCGYAYDSSFNSFEINRRYGKVDFSKHRKNGIAIEISNSFFEIPISNLNIGKIVLPWGGGGYFRLIPSVIFQIGVRVILQKQGAYLFYMHPWEVDPGQPKVSDASMLNRFRHYLNIHKTLPKLTLLFENNGLGSFVSCREYLANTFGVSIAA